MLKSMKRDGVGLLLVDGDGGVTRQSVARDPSLQITLDSTLSLGAKKKEVADFFQRFNDGDRKSAFFDLCELFERLVTALAIKASKIGWLAIDESVVANADLNTKINLLASHEKCKTPKGGPIVPSDLKDRLHSFRVARNLVHPPNNKRAEVRRQQQFVPRMLEGPTLVAELLALTRQVK